MSANAPVTSRGLTPEAEHERRGASESGRRGQFGVLNAFSHTFLIFWAVLVTFPLLWTIYTAFKSDKEILTTPWTLPSKLRWSNFSRAWTTANVGKYFVNTAIVVVGGVVLTLVLSSMVAYVLARYEFFGNRFFYYLFAGGLMFPVFLAIVPLFFVAKNLHLLNSLTGLIIIYAAYSLPFSVFFLTAFFRTLPNALAESAFIDGCGHWGTFIRIMLPLAKPGLISIGIFNVLGQWNQYLLPLVLETDPNKYTIAQGIRNIAISQGYRGDWSGLFAGLTLSMLPVLVVYVVFQRQVQAGMTAGALK
jgi:N-acetylglucosamine transport system permease protein